MAIYLYMALGVALLLILLAIVFRNSIKKQLNSGKDKEAKAELARMAAIIQGLCQKDPKWKKKWPAAGRLHTFINTSILEKYRASKAYVRDKVANRYGLEHHKAKIMLNYYRSRYLPEAGRLYEKEKAKQERLAQRAKERGKKK
ncbi:hypothetical protein HQ571_00975 [Candidatus Kuenenbacteria bacterium]|nr:hypothetical protein [Candidatus Kuenenbacteria bacterium]